jgi:quercetin dioxygenase-like cupin family protein
MRKNKSRKPALKSPSTKKETRSVNPIALKGTVAKSKRKAEMRHIPWNSVAVENLNPLLGRQLVVGQNIMLARVLLKKGCVVPEHSHPNEQVTYILEGALKFWIDGREIVIQAGETLTIPPNMPHKAEAVEDTVDLDVFYPPRADWMSGSDSYLR